MTTEQDINRIQKGYSSHTGTRVITEGSTAIKASAGVIQKIIVLKGGDMCTLTVKDDTTTKFETILNDNYTRKGLEIKPYEIDLHGMNFDTSINVELHSPAATRHYKFDDDINTPSATVVDYGSDGTDGTIANCETADRITAKIGMGLELDGVDEQINTTDVITTTGNDPFSISVWVYLDVINVYHYLIYQYEDTHNYIQIAVIGNGRLYIAARRLNAYLDLEGTQGDISLSTWHHLVLTYDGSLKCSGFKFYLDSVNVPLKSKREDMVDGLTWSTTVTNIGKTFNGKIDDFRHYAEALTPEEIKLLYNEGYGTEDDFNLGEVLVIYE